VSFPADRNYKKRCKNKRDIYIIYTVCPKKRRKPYLRYLWLDLNGTGTGVNHFESAISTTSLDPEK
jgi:hypothetical protein